MTQRDDDVPAPRRRGPDWLVLVVVPAVVAVVVLVVTRAPTLSLVVFVVLFAALWARSRFTSLHDRIDALEDDAARRRR